MSKNMTQKGLALGAAAALAISGFSALPANAAGLLVSGYVTLTPASGAEYDVLTGDKRAFSFASNAATAAIGTGKYTKFLVEDASGTIVADQGDANDGAAFNGTAQSTLYEVASTGFAESGGVVSVAVASHKFKTGDRISYSDSTDAANDITGVVLATTTATSVKFTGTMPEGTTDTGLLRLLPNTAAAGKFVYQTRDDGNGSAKVLVLKTAASETLARTATVTAWIDNNNNDLIEDSEYVSEVRTVRWLTPSSLAITTVVDPVMVGDDQVTAYATTVPVLNGAYVTPADVQAEFNRPGSALTETDGTSSWSATTKKFSFSQTLVPTANLWEDTKNVAAASASVGTNKITINTAAAHGLTAGDVVFLTGFTGTGATAPGVITVDSVTDTDTFVTVAVSSLTAVTLSNAWVGTQNAVAGTYTVKAIFDNAQTTANSATGTYSTAAVAVSSIAAEVTPADGVASDGDIRTGVKAATVSAVVKDVDGEVLAGRLVKVASSGTLTGTHYLNGTKLVTSGDFVYVTSDANGVATVAVTSDTAATGNNLDLDFTSEGASATTVELDWMLATYTLHEVTEGSNSQNNRSMDKGGSYTLDLAVIDDWGVAISGTDYRLLVTASNAQVFSTPFTLTNGRASVTLNDAGLATNNVTAAVVLQKVSSGVWSTSTTPSLSRSFVVSIVDQTDVVLLDIDNSTAYGNATADLADTITTGALTAVADTVLNNGVVFDDSTNVVVVSGRVAKSTTNVGRAGATVTLTGPSDILFVAGNKSGFGSVTFVADNNGEFSAKLFSNKVQASTVVTATSGSASKTTKVTFAATNNSGAKSAVISAPATALPGSTFTVKAQILDKFGNALDTAATDNGSAAKFTLTYTGPGIVFGQLPTETDATGVASFAVLLGTNDVGTGVVTVSYDYDGTGIGYVAAAATASVVVGTAASNVASWTKNLNDGTVKMYAKNIVGAGKVQFMLNGKEIAWVRATSAADSKLRTANGASYLVRTVDLVEGQKNVLEIYVDGVRTARTAYTY